MAEYSKNFLLDRLYGELDKYRSESNIKIPRCNVIFQNKKTIFMNFGTICQNINRPELQLKKYFDVELLCETSIDSKHHLLLNKRFSNTNIQKVFNKFLEHYVMCKQCKSINTTPIKHFRINILKCNVCKSETHIKNF